MNIIKISTNVGRILDIHNWLDINSPGWKYVGINPNLYRQQKEEIARIKRGCVEHLLVDLPTKNHIMLFKLSWTGQQVRIFIV